MQYWHSIFFVNGIRIASENWLDYSIGRAMDRQFRDWGFESPVKPFNFRMLKKFVLISFIKSDTRKTLSLFNFPFSCTS